MSTKATKKVFFNKKRQDSQETKEESKESNQKKSRNSRKSTTSIETEPSQMDGKKENIHLTSFSENLFRFDKEKYMETFILEDKTSKYHCICDICNKEKFYAQYAIQHIKSKKHRDNTEKNKGKRALIKLDKLLDSINEAKGSLYQDDKKTRGQIEEEETKKYLEFIAFALSQRLSFLQIAKLGSFLREMLTRKDGIGLNFFKYQSFDRDFISNLASECFRPFLLDNLKQKLTENKFSFSIDSSTVAGENLCAVKVKFLDQDYDNNTGQRTTKICNQVIGVKKLGQSSNAQTFADIIKEKVLFNNNMEIKKIIIGLTTDRAQTLLGDQAGLITLLRKDFDQQIFHLPDPCHSLSLVIKHSLRMLPEDSHFYK